jgi:hypothetical protein
MGAHFPARVFACLVLLAITAWPQNPTSLPKDRVFVGILDDAREEMVNWKPGVAKNRVVRPAFERTALGWENTDETPLPAHINWTVAFDGRNLGSIETETGEDGFTAIHKILSPPRDVPSVGQPSQQFAGIMGMGAETKFHRPLVVVSQPNFRDPDGWKRARLPDNIAAAVRAAFRREYPHVDRCKDETIVEPDWEFPDSALSFPSAYASNKNSFLAEADIDSGDCGWIDQPDQPESGPWFFVSNDGNVKRVGSFMSLLDAGDYDNDGKSEFIFFLSQGENTGGFALFDASFKKQISMLWHYH